ncbi:hypothetical protein [Bosea sp. (in: a-proteobacteria)]|uniref:hypothetical protein n=1 Tax=Bosea sp. (in: a-proteobacteria) TaxID=1871050 RepID=UPI00260E1295|nr:hypothetical protein [Bosea sp. (in: a-proteobacteria)]MCO5091724.1 hypothetical protein [Bosea sp. (in: a-proteobacteria)]
MRVKIKAQLDTAIPSEQIGASIEVSMYKRNQINEVLVKAIRSTYSSQPDEVILTRIKRLLDSDRKSRLPSSGDTRSSFAFHDDDAAGSGRDVTFSAYSVLALFLALRLMNCGLPQGRAVSALRRFRESLEQEHRRMSEVDIASLLNIEGTVIAGATALSREKLIAKGNVVEDSGKMVFFCVHADLEAVGEVTRMIAGKDGPRPDIICRGWEELEKRVKLDGYSNSPTLIVELMNPFIQLNHLLSKTQPARRGRRRGA